MTMTTETRTYASCEACGSERELDVTRALTTEPYHPTACSRCGATHRFKRDADGLTVMLLPEDKWNVPAWLIVRIEGSSPPVYFVIDQPIYAHSRFDPELEEIERFYIEESTCPTNTIRVNTIIVDGDTDPHGVLEYMGHVPKSTMRPLVENGLTTDYTWEEWVAACAALQPDLGEQVLDTQPLSPTEAVVAADAVHLQLPGESDADYAARLIEIALKDM